MKKLSDDHIRWILDLDAKGVQAELKKLSSQSMQYADDNRKMNAEIKAAEKQMKETQKAMEKLSKAGKENSKEYKELKMTYESVSDEITTYRKRISENTRAIELNNRKHDETVRTMRIEDATMAQLEQRAKMLEDQLRHTAKATQPEAYAALTNELASVRSRMGELNSGSKSTFSTFKGGVAVFAGNMMTKALDKVKEMAIAFKDWVAEGIEAAGVIEGVTRAFNQLDKTGNLLNKLQQQTRGLIADDDLKKAAVRADKYKIDIEEVGNLLEFAGRRATDMGKSVQDFQERIIDGIGKESKVILDDLGLTSTEINAAIAKTGSFADGVIKVVNDELAKQGVLELTAADIRQRNTVAWANAQGEIGDKLLWIDKIWSQLSTNFANDVMTWAKETLPGLIQKVVDLYNWFVELYNKSFAFRAIIGSMVAYYKVLWEAAKVVLSNMVNAWTAIGGVVKGALTLDWELMKNSAKDYLDKTKDLVVDFAKDVKNIWDSTAVEITNGQLTPFTIPTSNTTTNDTGPIIKPKKDPKPDKDGDKKQAAAQKLALEKLEMEHQNKLEQIRKDYRDKKIGTEAEYNRKLFAQEQAYMLLREEMLENFIQKTTKKELKSDLENKLAELRNKRLEQEIKFRTELEKIILDANPLEKEKKEYEERLSAVGLFGVDRQQMTEQQLQALELLETQHMENVEKIELDAQNRKKKKSEREFEQEFKDRKNQMQVELNDLMQQNAANTGSSAWEAEMAVHLQRLKMINEEMEARTKAGLDIKKLLENQGKEEAALTKTMQKEATSRYKSYTQYANSMGTALGNVLTGQENAMQAFGNALMDIFFDIISQIIETKIMEATAVAVAEQAKSAAIAAASPDSVMSFGATSIARTAAIGAIIMGALQAAKTTLKGMLTSKSSNISTSSLSSSQKTGQRVYAGFADGGYHEGYTGDGGKYEVKGFFNDGQPYHAGEYIIPQEVLRMPAVAPIIRQIETVRNTFSTRNPLPDGFADGGYHASTPNSEMLIDNNIFRELTNAIDRLNRKELELNYYTFEKKKKLIDNARAGATKR